jgi:para-nitrobenzyl esterase
MPAKRRGLLGLAALALTLPAPATPTLGAPRPIGKKPAPPPNITVETHRGKVRGDVDGAVKAFKGIPYAAPTGALNRFRPPRPAPVWTEIRDAIAYGPMCPQLPRLLAGVTASWTFG